MTAIRSRLINSPFKDFTLIANDEQKIQVHKCVLYEQSEVLDNIFTDIGMKMETNYKTGCDYDTLMCVVIWMYGIKPTPWTNNGPIETSNVVFSTYDRTVTTKWHELHVVADKLGIDSMLFRSIYIYSLRQAICS